MNETFASRLKRLRLKNNYTQKTLAQIAHISKHTISNYEQEVSEPVIPYLLELAKVLDVSPEYLYFGDNNMKNYTDAIKNELLQLTSPEDILEIKRSKFNATILSHLEMTDALVLDIQTEWNNPAVFKLEMVSDDDNGDRKITLEDSYCTRAFVQEVILKYCQHRAKFKTKFGIKDGFLNEKNT